MKTRTIQVDGIGAFVILGEPEARTVDSEKCVREICGWRDPALAKRESSGNDRCGQEYSYRYRAQVEDVRRVLDIGCNVGGYTVWSAASWWPGRVAHIDAYDPHPELCALTRLNARNLIPGVTVEVQEAAVAVEDEPMYLEDVCTGRSRTFDVDVPFGEAATPPRPVRGIHPADLPAADAVKCDAEGAELGLLMHYRHWGRVLVAQIEWHDHIAPRARETMFAVLQGHGLQLAKNDCGEAEQGVACWVRP